MTADLIVYHISQLVTLQGTNALRCGIEMEDISLIENGFIAVKDGKFMEVGQGEGYKNFIGPATQCVDGSGYLVTPGLIDSHTHLVHAGSREHEFELKLKGVPYLEILKQGGGIINTVSKTRQATFDELFIKAKRSLDLMLLHGVTTVEAKSGYGLNLETEVKQLEVAKALNEVHPVDIKSTFMGAHAIPLEYKHNKLAYIEEVVKMQLVIKERNLAEYCDVFCEDEVFNIEESRYILSNAKKLGFKIKIHADEIVPLGGATLAVELGCVSADHLMASTNDDYDALAKNKIVANLLPATSFNLNKDYARARQMITQNCGIALSSDYNPGSCPTENLQLVMQIASIKMKMTPKEVMTAVTINGACSLNVENKKGSIEKGKDADFVLFNCPNLDYLIYHFGINHVKDVYKDGKMVVKDQQLIY